MGAAQGGVAGGVRGCQRPAERHPPQGRRLNECVIIIPIWLTKRKIFRRAHDIAPTPRSASDALPSPNLETGVPGLSPHTLRA
jgi:hypothetical protein